MNTNPPSHSFQHWGFMFITSLFLGLIISGVSIYITWDWFTPWDSFERHWPYFMTILKEYFIGEQVIWPRYYVEYLVKHNWVNDFWLHLSLPAVFSFISASYLSFKLLYLHGGRTYERHVKGVRLYQDKGAEIHAKHELKRECKGGGIPSLFLHPNVQVTEQIEVDSTLVTGKPGSGKTVIILSILKQLVHRRTRILIYDAKREYTAKLYQSKCSILIAPWDSRSDIWNIALDMQHRAAPTQFAKHIITDTSEPIWCQSARLIFTGIITSLKADKKPWGWKQLFEAMSTDEAKLHALLEQHYPQALRFVQENNRTTDSIMMTLLSDLQWIEWLAIAWPDSHQGSFSINQWVKSNKVKPRLIVQGHSEFEVVGAPLCHALMSMMTDAHLARKSSRKCYLLLDELANFPKSPSLLRWLEMGRDRGGHTIACTQSLSSLKAIYGEHETDSLTSMFGNLITLKVGSTGGTAEYMSKALGDRLIERPHYNTDTQGKSSTSWQSQTLPTIQTSELTQLPKVGKHGVPGFLTINGWEATYRLTWPFPLLANLAKREVLADWVNDIDQHPVFRPSHVAKKDIKDSEYIPDRIKQRRCEEGLC